MSDFLSGSERASCHSAKRKRKNKRGRRMSTQIDHPILHFTMHWTYGCPVVGGRLLGPPRTVHPPFCPPRESAMSGHLNQTGRCPSVESAIRFRPPSAPTAPFTPSHYFSFGLSEGANVSVKVTDGTAENGTSLESLTPFLSVHNRPPFRRSRSSPLSHNPVHSGGYQMVLPIRIIFGVVYFTSLGLKSTLLIFRLKAASQSL